MGMREWMNDNSAVAMIVAAVVLVLALVIVWTTLGGADESGPPPSEDTTVYYYDLNSNELFPGPKDAIPPIDAPSGTPYKGGPAGVRAYVFTCGACNPDDWNIVYLEKFTPTGREMLLEQRRRLAQHPEATSPILRPDSVPVALANQWLIRAVDDQDWIQVSRSQARQIMSQGTICKSTPARLCRPGSPR